MTDRPLVQFRPLSRFVPPRLPMLGWRNYGLAGPVQRKYRSLSIYHPHLASVQRQMLSPSVQRGRSELGWRPTRIVWVGMSGIETSRETPGETEPPVPWVPVARPAAVQTVARRREPEGVRGPLAREADEPRHRVTVEPRSPAPPPVSRQPETLEEPESEVEGPTIGLMRGSDLWRRMFPERPSFRERMQAREEAARRKAEARKAPPPRIPDNLPRTRTWEISPSHTGVSRTPAEAASPVPRAEPPGEDVPSPPSAVGEDEAEGYAPLARAGPTSPVPSYEEKEPPETRGASGAPEEAAAATETGPAPTARRRDISALAEEDSDAETPAPRPMVAPPRRRVTAPTVSRQPGEIEPEPEEPEVVEPVPAPVRAEEETDAETPAPGPVDAPPRARAESAPIVSRQPAAPEPEPVEPEARPEPVSAEPVPAPTPVEEELDAETPAPGPVDAPPRARAEAAPTVSRQPAETELELSEPQARPEPVSAEAAPAPALVEEGPDAETPTPGPVAAPPRAKAEAAPPIVSRQPAALELEPAEPEESPEPVSVEPELAPAPVEEEAEAATSAPGPVVSSPRTPEETAPVVSRQPGEPEPAKPEAVEPVVAPAPAKEEIETEPPASGQVVSWAPVRAEATPRVSRQPGETEPEPSEPKALPQSLSVEPILAPTSIQKAPVSGPPPRVRAEAAPAPVEQMKIEETDFYVRPKPGLMRHAPLPLQVPVRPITRQPIAQRQRDLPRLEPDVQDIPRLFQLPPEKPAPLPLRLPASPAPVQRQAETPADSGPTSPDAAQAPPDEEETAAPESPDIAKMAHEVYEILKRRLIVEREQLRGF